MCWMIYCKIVEDLILDIDFKSDEGKKLYPDTFITKNGLQDILSVDATMTVLYFSFTTLSTVGFGDYVPRTDDERIIGILILVFGVAIFSIIMGSFVDILVQFKTFNEEFSDERLSTFFEIMKHFNNN